MALGLGIGLGFGRRRGGSAPPTSTNTTVQAWLNKIGSDGYTYPTQAKVDIYTAAWNYADTNSLTAQFDLVGLTKVDNVDLCKIPFIHTGGSSVRFTLNGTYFFTPNAGIVSDFAGAGDGYIGTNYFPATNAVHSSLNDFCFGTKNINYDDAGDYSMGCKDLTGLAAVTALIPASGGISFVWVNRPTNRTSVILVGDNFYSVSRITSSSFSYYINGVLKTTQTSYNSTFIPNTELYVLNSNDSTGGLDGAGSAMPTQFFFVAKGTIDQVKLNTFVNMLLL